MKILVTGVEFYWLQFKIIIEKNIKFWNRQF